MDKEEFLRFFEENEDRFIPGIYNYCDRWCERCPFTSKCSVFAMEEKDEKGNNVENDLRSNEFWNKMGDVMTLTMELIMDMAEEHEIDLNELDKEDFKKERVKLEQKADSHILAKLSRKYIDVNRLWFENNEKAIEEKQKEFQKKAELNITPEKTEKEFLKMSDYMEVIQWYTFQIHIKIKRALMNGDPNPEYEDFIQNDMNGSAKVALVGVERSISGWSGIFQNFPEQEDEILNLLVMLEKIRNGIQKTFPDVHKFIRPGFDE
ncbi:MAG: hypothetical protein WEA56_15615 [Balneolaceae bacterium]